MDDALPWLGLGLSSNLSVRDIPNPYRLHEDRPDLFDFVEYSAPLALDEARRDASLFQEMWRRRGELPVLFHPVHLNLYGPKLETPETLRALDDHLEQVGSPWVSNDVAWWHVRGRAFPGYLYLPPPLEKGALEDCVAHAVHVQSALSVPLLLENPAIFAPRGDLHVLDFMAELHRRTGCRLLLDLGHLLSHQLACDLPLETGLDGFPLEQVVQIHVAGGVVTRHGPARVYMDDHSQPVRDEVFQLLERILPRCQSLRAVTFEGDGHPSPVVGVTLERLRKWVPRRSPSVEVAARNPVVPQSAGAPDSVRSWNLFTEVFCSDPQDALALGEREVRMAVLAERLDAYWPCTRLMLLPTQLDLEAFSASPEYRAHFEDDADHPLHEAFGAYARRKLREKPDERVAMVLAFETWMHAAVQRQVHREPDPGELTLADGVAVATFPADLSEVTFAVRALRRHLQNRAWATGNLELSALDALLQTAGRSLQRPWTVALRRRVAGVELILLEPRLAHLLQAVAAGAKESDLRSRPEEYPPSSIIQAQATRLLMRKARMPPVVE
jgi:uncharacterized protein